MTKHSNSLPKGLTFFYAITMDMQNLDLRPNCLITPSDLVFIPGPRSLFFYKNPFGLLPEFLYEHGYRVQTLSLPFRNRTLRMMAFEIWLKNHDLKNQAYHFIMDELTFTELGHLINSSQTKSLTVLTTDENIELKPTPNHKTSFFSVDKTSVTPPLRYRLHKLFNLFYRTEVSPYSLTFSGFNRTTYDRFLDHCVKLAENELYA